LHVSFKVTNSGAVAGRDTPQAYVTDRAGKPGQRLIGWGNVDLAPGASQTVTIDTDPRLLADWAGHGWSVPGGRYDVTVNTSAVSPQLNGSAVLAGRTLPP
jgi:beta-glucosidase